METIMNKQLTELIICAIEQGYGLKDFGMMGVTIQVYIRLVEIKNGI